MKRIRLLLLPLLVLSAALTSAAPQVLPLRDRAVLIDQWLQQRVATVLPKLMRRSGIDLWVIISREYNEDPVLKTMLPSTWQSARRRTILLIHDPGADAPLETLAIARYNVGTVFKKAWDKERHGDQWQRLAKLVAERDPKRIGLNYSDTFALADGVTHTEYDLFKAALAPSLQQRIVSAEALAIGWLETRTPQEMIVYPQIMRIAHDVIAEGLSEAVIQPGATTTADVAWWYRDRIAAMQMTAWFHPVRVPST